MEGKKTQPRALLIFGAPCCGKTTFGEKFAKRFHMTVFNIPATAQKYQISRKMVLIILAELARTQQNLLIEGGLETKKARNEIKNLFRSAGYHPSIVWIQTDSATIRARLKSRHRSIATAKDAYETALANFEPPTKLEHPIIISGKHTFETQTRHVLTGLAQ